MTSGWGELWEEGGKIYSGESPIIVTGVPRPGRDDEFIAALERGDYKDAATADSRYEAFAEANKPVETTSIPPLPGPTPPVEPPPQPKYVRTQLRAPNPERDDPGAGGDVFSIRFAPKAKIVRRAGHVR